MKFLLPAITLTALLTHIILAETILLDEKLDEPNGDTYFYPPQPKSGFPRVTPSLAGWAINEGQIAITYGEKLGTNNSGGLACKVALSTAGGGYLALNCELPKMPVASADEVDKIIRDLQFDFDIQVPTSRTVNFYLQISSTMLPKDPVQREAIDTKAFSQRAIFPKLGGNDEYTHYSFKVSDLPPAEIDKIVDIVSKCVTSGAIEINLNVSWFLFGSEWKEGDQFSIDNIRVSSSL